MRAHRWIVVVAAFVVVMTACGGDDGEAESSPSSVPPADSDAAESDAAESDEAESDEDEGDQSDNGSGGSGVVTIDGGSYEFTAEVCEGGDDQLVRIAGPGTTPDGEPFWVEVRWGLGGPVATQLGVGITEPSASAEGDPHWYNRLDDGVEYVSFDDGYAVSYEAPFNQASAPNEPEVPGTVDASCQPS